MIDHLTPPLGPLLNQALATTTRFDACLNPLLKKTLTSVSCGPLVSQLSTLGFLYNLEPIPCLNCVGNQFWICCPFSLACLAVCWWRFGGPYLITRCAIGGAARVFGLTAALTCTRSSALRSALLLRPFVFNHSHHHIFYKLSNATSVPWDYNWCLGKTGSSLSVLYLCMMVCGVPFNHTLLFMALMPVSSVWIRNLVAMLCH